MENEMVSWLLGELNRRGWSNAELSRRAGISDAMISLIISGQRNPGIDACVGIAGAFGERPETVLRLAGLLPPLPPAVVEEDDALALIRTLTAQHREGALLMLRGLASDGGAASVPARATIAEERAPYGSPLQEFIDLYLTADDETRQELDAMIRMALRAKREGGSGGPGDPVQDSRGDA